MSTVTYTRHKLSTDLTLKQNINPREYRGINPYPSIIKLYCFRYDSSQKTLLICKHLEKNKTALCPFRPQFIFTGEAKRRSLTCRYLPCRHAKSFLKQPPREFKKIPVCADIVYVAISHAF